MKNIRILRFFGTLDKDENPIEGSIVRLEDELNDLRDQGYNLKLAVVPYNSRATLFIMELDDKNPDV